MNNTTNIATTAITPDIALGLFIFAIVAFAIVAIIRNNRPPSGR